MEIGCEYYLGGLVELHKYRLLIRPEVADCYFSHKLYCIDDTTNYYYNNAYTMEDNSTYKFIKRR